MKLLCSASANSSMNYLEDEVDRVKEENRNQHEQILALQSQLQDTEDKLRKVSLKWKVCTKEMALCCVIGLVR